MVRAGSQLVGTPVLLHVIAETAQHAGHADILRESIDGAKTMG
ncbi:mycothiol transferase [Micromonospora yasonensis]